MATKSPAKLQAIVSQSSVPLYESSKQEPAYVHEKNERMFNFNQTHKRARALIVNDEKRARELKLDAFKRQMHAIQDKADKEARQRKLAMANSSFGADERWKIDKEKAARPISYMGFKSFDQRANGRAISSNGTFSTVKRETFTGQCTTDVAFYNPTNQVGSGVPGSQGVKRTSERFKMENEEDQVGPIYKPLEMRYMSSMKFSSAPRWNYKDEPPLSERDNEILKRATTPSKRPVAVRSTTPCTFGMRAGKPENIDYTAESEITYKGNVEQMPYYKGKWGKAGRAKPATESLPGPGHFLKNDYQSNAAKWTIGRRRKDPDTSLTPGPCQYRPEKYDFYGKPDAPTFSRKDRDTLEFEAGRDSPGPAVYSNLRKHRFRPGGEKV